MRSISTALRTELFKQNSGIQLGVLVTLSHPDFPSETIRIGNLAIDKLTDAPLTYGCTSNGNIFTVIPFDIMLPDDQDKRGTSSQLIVSNLKSDRDLPQLLRKLPDPGKCTIQLVRSNALSSIEMQWVDLDIRGISGNIQFITIEFGVDSLEREPIPAGRFTPSGFPALHGVVI